VLVRFQLTCYLTSKLLHSRLVGTFVTFCKNPDGTDAKISNITNIARESVGSLDHYLTARTMSGVSSVFVYQQMEQLNALNSW
jgi:hypothetical protein